MMFTTKKPEDNKPSSHQLYSQVASALDIARQQMGQVDDVLAPNALALWLKLHEAQALADKLSSRV